MLSTADDGIDDLLVLSIIIIRALMTQEICYLLLMMVLTELVSGIDDLQVLSIIIID